MWVGLLLALQQSHASTSCDSTEPTTAVAPHTARGLPWRASSDIGNCSAVGPHGNCIAQAAVGLHAPHVIRHGVPRDPNTP